MHKRSKTNANPWVKHFEQNYEKIDESVSAEDVLHLVMKKKTKKANAKLEKLLEKKISKRMSKIIKNDLKK